MQKEIINPMFNPTQLKALKRTTPQSDSLRASMEGHRVMLARKAAEYDARAKEVREYNSSLSKFKRFISGE